MEWDEKKRKREGKRDAASRAAESRGSGSHTAGSRARDSRVTDSRDVDSRSVGSGSASSTSTASSDASRSTHPSNLSLGAQAAAEYAAHPLEALHHVREVLEALSDVEWTSKQAAELHPIIDEIEQTKRRLGATYSRVVDAAEEEGSWALDGHRSFPAWLTGRTFASPGACRKDRYTARRLRDNLPQTLEALQAGVIGQGHVDVLVREATKSEKLREMLPDPELGEAFLLPMAQKMDAGQFLKAVKAWAIRVDPDGADRKWRDLAVMDYLTVSPTIDGYHVAGWLSTQSGKLVEKALAAFAGRKAADDHRSFPERLAESLVTMAGAHLDAGTKGEYARVRPHISVTVAWDTLHRLAHATKTAIPTNASKRAGEQTELPIPTTGRHSSDSVSDSSLHPTPSGNSTTTGAATMATGAAGSPEATGGYAGNGEDAGSAPDGGFEAEWVNNFRKGDDLVISARYNTDALIGAEPATYEDGTPLSPAELARVVCSSQLARVVFGPKGEVLDTGREERIFNASQARGVIARDKECKYPGCHEPPNRGEIHHSLWWGKHQGETNVDQGILLCFHHHTLVHAREIDIARINGTWVFTNKHGDPITIQNWPSHLQEAEPNT